MFEMAINVFESILIIVFTYSLLHRKYESVFNWFWVGAFSLLYLVYISSINLFSVSESFLTFINYLLIFLFTCVVSDDSFSYRLFTSTLALNIIGIENTAQNMTLSYLLFGKVDYYLLMGSLRIPNVLASQLIHVVMFYLLHHSVKKMKTFISDKDFYIITVLSMLCNYLSISFEAVAIGGEHCELYMILGIYETLAFVVILYLLFRSIFQHSQNESNQQLKLEIYKTQAASNEKILKAQKELYHLRHDMKHFIQALKDIPFGEFQEQVDLTIEQYDRYVASSPVPIQTSSPAINYILNIKREEAMIKNIEFISKINIPHPITMEDSDVYLLLANLLDNAIAHIGMGKKIYVEMNDINDMFMIRVTNSVDQQLLDEHHNFLSYRMDDAHGYGVKTIELLAEKYGGFVSYNQADWELVATCLFPIRLISQ